MSVSQSGSSNAGSTTLFFVNCPNINGNSAGEGGVFYINQPLIVVHLINVVISNSIATGIGGVVSI